MNATTSEMLRLEAIGIPGRPSSWARMRRMARQQPLGVVGLFIIAVLVITAAFAPWIAPYDPINIDADAVQAPSSAHWFGTDDKGRDVFSRVVYGSRESLEVGLVATLVATAGGAIVGLLSGFFGGIVDMVLQRIMDALQAVPFLVLALVLVSIFGNATWKMMIVVGLAIVPGQGRVMRSAVLQQTESLYVEAARSIGASPMRLMWRHVFPNVMQIMIVLGTALLGSAILIESGLAFLGFGTPPPAPSWGADLSGSARQYFREAPWMAIFPGLALSLVVLGANILGDALRDILDPRLRNR